MVASQAQMPLTKPIISFCAGHRHSCAVFNNKKIKCWGRKRSFGASLIDFENLGDDVSELGNGIPYINIGTGIGIEQVSCGGQYVCMRFDTGDMKCLGSNEYGQLGIGSKEEVVGVATGYGENNLPSVIIGIGLQVIEIALGFWHSCAVVTGRKVKCFGLNDHGQLGLGHKVNKGTSLSDMGDALQLVDLGAGVEVASIHSGSVSYHSCVILSKPTPAAQRIKCWGYNFFGQLGYSDQNYRGDEPGEMGDNLSLIYLGTESRVKQIVLGRLHTCAIIATDMLKCWGYNLNGQLASGSTATTPSTSSGVPFVPIDSFKTIKLLTTGADHVCFVYDDKVSMKCVGYNSNGELGQGDTVKRGDTPSTMIPFFPNINLGTGSLQISSIYSGHFHNCVLFEDSTMKCFGWNGYGQLAIGLINKIGDQPGEMGLNLPYINLFPSTAAPTKTPTSSAPTVTPTSPLETATPTSAAPTITPTSSLKTATQNPTTKELAMEPTTSSNQALVIGLSVGIPLIIILISCSCWYMRRKTEPKNVKSNNNRETNNNNNSNSHTMNHSNAGMSGASAAVPVANTVTEKDAEIEMKNQIKNNENGKSTTNEDHQSTASGANTSNSLPVAEAITLA